MKKNLLIAVMLMFCAATVISCDKKDDNGNEQKNEQKTEQKENFFKFGSKTFDVEYVTLYYYGELLGNGMYAYSIEFSSGYGIMELSILFSGKTIPSSSKTYNYSASPKVYGCWYYNNDRTEKYEDDLSSGSATINKNGDTLEIEFSAKTLLPENKVMSGYYKGKIDSYEDCSDQ